MHVYIGQFWSLFAEFCFMFDALIFSFSVSSFRSLIWYVLLMLIISPVLHI